MAKKDVPYYLADSDSEDDAHKESGAPPKEGEELTAGGLSAILKQGKKAQIGKVELDPGIDFADFARDGPGLESRASLDEGGMINIWVNLKKDLPDIHKDYATEVVEYATDPDNANKCPPLNIVIFIVGSRGDVQPYLSLALRMIQSHGHRIRIATHPDFKDFVISANKGLKGKHGKDGKPLEGMLEYFDAGGDPKELMAYMVKNPGLLPGWESLKNGDIASKRKMTGELLAGFYQSTYCPDPISGRPFAADAIMSNPPAFGHVHIAESLGLPLHMSFTMPWSPTTSFNHPLVNIQQSNAEKGMTNYLSYAFADIMTWQGLGDIINDFREKSLGLEPLSGRSGPALLERLKVPWTYCWSANLIPKPRDWKEHIDISGFYFMAGESDFKPDQDLADYLAKGDAPIYIGFGSVVVEDPAAMTQTIFDAVKLAGVRAIVSAGWGGLGGTDIPDGVFIQQGAIPHDWLFANERVTAVCHHGGAGTTAIGLRNGLPTIVVPFFGDQKFWGEMIHRAGAGPEPIPHKTLTAENLSAAIKYATSEPAKKAAQQMAEGIKSEDGEEKGLESFHRHLPLKVMRCELDPARLAHWWSTELELRLSGAAAGLLHQQQKIDIAKLSPLRSKEYESRRPYLDPISGGTTAVFNMITKYHVGMMQMFYNPQKGAVNYVTSIPQGLSEVIVSLYEGFDAIPQYMGSEIREREKVDSLASGVREGAKGVWYGWWDGITGLVKEPIEGGRKEGALGVIKGMGRSYVNVTAKPAAGIMGAMALPIRGISLSLRQKMSGKPQQRLREPRELLSHQAAKDLTEKERSFILKQYGEAAKTTNERKKKMRRRAERVLEGDQSALEESLSKGETTASTASGDDSEDVKTPKGGEGGTVEEGDGQEEELESDDIARQRLLDAEKRGYERALKELQAQQQAGSGGAEGSKKE